MKKLGKINAYVLSAVMVVVFALGALLSFVPMSFGKKDYESFLGSLSLSTEIKDGISAEYSIKGDHTSEEIASSLKVMEEVISEYGFKSVNVYQKGADKIRVDINSTVLEEDKSTAQNLLTTIASGKLEIKDANKPAMTAEEGIVIDGSKHIEKITRISSRGASGTISGIQIDFTKEGKELYSQATGKKLYMFVGGKAWPGDNTNNEIPANTDPSSTSLYLMFNSSDVVDNYYYILRAGTMNLDLDAENVQIASTSSKAAQLSSVILLIIVIALEIALIAILIIKFRLLALPSVVTSLIGFMALLFLMQAMNWVTIGRASVIAIIMLELLTYVISYSQCAKIKEEYLIGKSMDASIEDGFRKTMVTTIEMLAGMLVIGLCFAAAMGGEIRALGTIVSVAAPIFAICLTVLNKLYIYVLYNLFPNKTNLFSLPKREEE